MMVVLRRARPQQAEDFALSTAKRHHTRFDAGKALLRMRFNNHQLIS
jgi:hypothetical protein